MASKRLGSAAAMATSAARAEGNRAPLRVVSLLPSATENFSSLLAFCEAKQQQQQQHVTTTERLPELVGRSHECDFPTTARVQSLPVLTAPRTAFTSSADTHDQVRQALADAASLYHLDAELLAALAPDVILTQSTCKVCSIDLATVESSLESSSSECSASSSAAPLIPALPGKTTRIVTCNPKSLVQALVDQFEQLGRELGVEAQGRALAQQHCARLDELRLKAQTLAAASGTGRAPRVLLVEWLDPLFVGKDGWMREIIECAGGDVVTTVDSDASPPIDVVVVALCGLSLDATEREVRSGRVGEWWRALQPASNTPAPALYLVDGTSMFTRPTQRLLLALEWLVDVLHDPHGAWRATSTFPFKQIDVADVQLRSTDASAMSPELLEIEELHAAACRNNEPMYTDPATGYSVLTAQYLLEKQVCCGNCCRHCPFGHANVADASRRKNAIAQDVFLAPSVRARRSASRGDAPPGGSLLYPRGYTEPPSASAAGARRDLVVMFWSGGKDSFLALSELYATYAAASARMPQVVLLTTIDPSANSVPVQRIDVSTIAAQARALELPLYLAAQGHGADYTATVTAALEQVAGKVQRQGDAIATLVFGDLHLADIRAWREQTFGAQYKLSFPLFGRDYATELLPALADLCDRTGARITYSAVESHALQTSGWQIGDAFDWRAVAAFNDAAQRKRDEEPIDLMGERGEFHTCVTFPSMA